MGIGDFPGCPVVKTLCFHCRGHGFWPLVKELRSHMLYAMRLSQNKKINKIIFFKRKMSRNTWLKIADRKYSCTLVLSWIHQDNSKEILKPINLWRQTQQVRRQQKILESGKLMDEWQMTTWYQERWILNQQWRQLRSQSFLPTDPLSKYSGSSGTRFWCCWSLSLPSWC